MNIEKLKQLAEIEIIVHPEDIAIEGNCSAIDEETDRETENWIKDQLARGNDLAWCCIEVKATYGDLEGHDFLGGCSYASLEQFKQCGYYADMVDQALSDLAAKLAKVDQAIELVK